MNVGEGAQNPYPGEGSGTLLTAKNHPMLSTLWFSWWLKCSDKTGTHPNQKSLVYGIRVVRPSLTLSDPASLHISIT